jgi:signal transduction histidine kinase
MRARLLIVLTTLGALTVIAFSIPLMLAQAESRTREFLLTRDADLQRFASLADSYVTGGPPGSLFDELQVYRDLYGEPIAVVSTRGVNPFTVDLDLADPGVADAITRALRNQQDTPVDRLTPFAADRVVLAKTTGTDAHINGAVVVAASTAAARSDITRSWVLVAIGVIASLLAVVAFVFAVSSWVLRPLGRLTGELTDLADGLPFRPAPTEDLTAPPPSGGPPELRSLSRTFDRMARTVRGSVQSQRQLIADTAHQLRNPLAALQLRLDALDGLVAPPAQTGYQQALAESERLAEILDDLLALSTAEAAQSADRAAAQTCLASSVIAERVEFWSRPAEAAGIGLLGPAIDDGAGRGDEPLLAMGRVELGQILDVLLDNACKYAGAGATITVRQRATVAPPAGSGPESGPVGGPGRVDIAVVDTGRGVPPGEIAKLTTRFYRGTSSAGPDGTRSRGTGLGLAIVDALSTTSGATLTVEPTPGGGLTVHLGVPIVTSPAPDGRRSSRDPVPS